MVDCLYRISKKKGVGWQNDFQLNQKPQQKTLTQINQKQKQSSFIIFHDWC